MKPADEPRMYHKLGKSLQRAGYHVYVGGHSFSTSQTDETSPISDIQLKELCRSKRLSLNRFLTAFKFFSWVLKIKPHLLIISTHELLIPAVLLKVFTRTKLIYDIRENYYDNMILLNHSFGILRYLLAGFLQIEQKITSHFVDHFFLAERCYETELSFIRSRYTILENKALYNSEKMSVRKKKESNIIRLLFTGTIAESTGIRQAIEMSHKLHRINNSVHLTIAGLCHSPTMQKELFDLAGRSRWVSLVGIVEAVPYERIIELINSADGGFITYQHDKLLGSKFPSKLYEYLAYQLPVILPESSPWKTVILQFDAGLTYTENTPPEVVIQKLKDTGFYSKTPSQEVYWDSVEKDLLKVVGEILH